MQLGLQNSLARHTSYLGFHSDWHSQKTQECKSYHDLEPIEFKSFCSFCYPGWLQMHRSEYNIFFLKVNLTHVWFNSYSKCRNLVCFLCKTHFEVWLKNIVFRKYQHVRQMYQQKERHTSHSYFMLTHSR